MIAIAVNWVPKKKLNSFNCQCKYWKYRRKLRKRYDKNDNYTLVNSSSLEYDNSSSNTDNADA